jgi:hypothetical protein
MKIVRSLRKPSKRQIANLSPRETANVIAVFTATKTPVDLKKAAIGTSVRPESATIVNGAETVESYLARGGTIKTGKPTKVIEPTIRVKGSRNMANTMLTARKTDSK